MVKKKENEISDMWNGILIVSTRVAFSYGGGRCNDSGNPCAIQWVIIKADF